MDNNDNSQLQGQVNNNDSQPQTPDNQGDSQPQTPPAEPKATIPEGFDADIYDIESQSLKVDKVKERLESLKNESESYKKQALDLRRKLSKGVDIPDNADKYKDDYVFDSKYDTVMSTDDVLGKFLNSTLDEINQLAFDTGMTTQQAKAVKDNFFKLMENVSIIDTRTEEQKKSDNEAFVKEQKEILGENADAEIKANLQYIENTGFFEGKTREYIVNELRRNPCMNILVMKYRTIVGDRQGNIPASRDILDDGLKTEQEYSREYFAENTSPARREEILRERIKAGRTEKLQLPY